MVANNKVQEKKTGFIRRISDFFIESLHTHLDADLTIVPKLLRHVGKISFNTYY